MSTALNSPTIAGSIRARWAVTLVFAANGVSIASLAVRTPSLKLEHGLSDGQLGLASTLIGISALVSMQFAGRWAARIGSARIVRGATLGLPVALLGVGLSKGFAQLCVAMVLFGAVHGLVDVTMNAHAVAVERTLGRPIMNGCHAAWSLGAVAGSLLGGAAAQAGMSLAVHYLGLGVVLVVVALLAGRRLLPPDADRTDPADHTDSADRTDHPGADRPRPKVAWNTGWTRRLLILGGIGACVLTCEAAVANWSGVLLHEHLGVSLGVASLGYIAFTACETAGRLTGDRLYARVAAPTLIRWGSTIAATGVALAVLTPWPALAVAGFAVMGLGLATPMPVVFSVVGRMGAAGPGAAVLLARLTTMTYSGILLGPALIGGLAEGIGLTTTLTLLIPLLLGVAVVSSAADQP